MKKNITRIGFLTLILSLVFMSAGFAFALQLNHTIYSKNIQSAEQFLQTADVTERILRRRLTDVQSELNQNEAELTQKRAELETLSTDLTAKIKELDSANKKIKDQQSQLSANAAELNKLRNRPPLFVFKVESSTLSNVEQKKEDVKQIVTAAYDVIESVYSRPYLLHSVTIAFVESFSNPNAAAEIVISNSKDGLAITIRIKDFDKNDFNDVNAIIHEVIHSFHGLAILSPVAYEEGITVAASDAVMQRLIQNGVIPAFSPLYVRISASDYANALPLPRDDNTFYTSSNVAAYYQTAGYGWYEIYKADNNFFRTFNEKLYTHKRNGNEVDEATVKQLIKDSTSATIQGKSIGEWLETKAFTLQ